VADPVSWMLIEPGWRVVGRDGEELGSVHEVVGDENVDIFTGLTIHHGLLKPPRYVPSERVAEIVEGRVVLDVGEDELESLDEQAPPGVT
jgi:uncharacterized protein YrrD